MRNQGNNQNRLDLQQNQNHAGYGYRNNRNNMYSYQNYQTNLSQDPHNTNTDFLGNQQPVMNMEWMMGELMRRMERLEMERMNVQEAIKTQIFHVANIQIFLTKTKTGERVMFVKKIEKNGLLEGLVWGGGTTFPKLQ